jgi:hypothetical protein
MKVRDAGRGWRLSAVMRFSVHAAARPGKASTEKPGGLRGTAHSHSKLCPDEALLEVMAAARVDHRWSFRFLA